MLRVSPRPYFGRRFGATGRVSGILRIQASWETFLARLGMCWKTFGAFWKPFLLGASQSLRPSKVGTWPVWNRPHDDDDDDDDDDFDEDDDDEGHGDGDDDGDDDIDDDDGDQDDEDDDDDDDD